jgi:hypothetical protein
MAANLSHDEHAAIRHWSTYGQPGSTPTNRVSASDWNTKPFHKPVTSSWNVKIQKSQLPLLLQGFRPREMEDKWFIYADGPDAEGRITLHLHRSWTGVKVAEIVVEAGPTEGKGGSDEPLQITKIIWESDQDVVRYESEREAKETARETCRWVLGVELEKDEA